ncbi:hypothetical protein GGR56DRAFT_362863 [Xylariaceae sp. FL0804]|nr:hypothetical protein GGR56DRAFT_362863 [Xylariaceae sp. FL0804]
MLQANANGHQRHDDQVAPEPSEPSISQRPRSIKIEPSLSEPSQTNLSVKTLSGWQKSKGPALAAVAGAATLGQVWCQPFQIQSNTRVVLTLSLMVVHWTAVVHILRKREWREQYLRPVCRSVMVGLAVSSITGLDQTTIILIVYPLAVDLCLLVCLMAGCSTTSPRRVV